MVTVTSSADKMNFVDSLLGTGIVWFINFVWKKVFMYTQRVSLFICFFSCHTHFDFPFSGLFPLKEFSDATRCCWGQADLQLTETEAFCVISEVPAQT